jgi:hypothetical protein
MRSPSCLSVCLPLPSTYEPNGRFLRNSVGIHAIEGDLDAIIFNSVASTIPVWWTFTLLRWIQNLHQLTRDHEILYADRSSEDEQRLIWTLLRESKKYEHDWQLKFKIHILFCGDNSWAVALKQTKFGTMKDRGPSYKFYLKNSSLWRRFWIWGWWDFQTPEVDAKIAQINVEPRQLLIRPLFRKTENTHMTGGWNLKFTFYFTKTTHESLQLRQMKLCTVQDHGHIYKFYLNRFLSRAFE